MISILFISYSSFHPRQEISCVCGGGMAFNSSAAVQRISSSHLTNLSFMPPAHSHFFQIHHSLSVVMMGPWWSVDGGSEKAKRLGCSSGFTVYMSCSNYTIHILLSLSRRKNTYVSAVEARTAGLNYSSIGGDEKGCNLCLIARERPL